MQEAERSKSGKSKHSQWRNYDDLNEYFWYHPLLSFILYAVEATLVIYAVLIYQKKKKKKYAAVFCFNFHIDSPLRNCRSVDCFRLGWPMRADADFFHLPPKQSNSSNDEVCINFCLNCLIFFLLTFLILTFEY